MLQELKEEFHASKAWTFTRFAARAFGDASEYVDEVNCPRSFCIYIITK